MIATNANGMVQKRGNPKNDQKPKIRGDGRVKDLSNSIHLQ